jgi:hypothetical protein
MKPTAYQKRRAAKMTKEQLSQAIATTREAIAKGGGSINLQCTRWQNLTALNAEMARR